MIAAVAARIGIPPPTAAESEELASVVGASPGVSSAPGWGGLQNRAARSASPCAGRRHARDGRARCAGPSSPASACWWSTTRATACRARPGGGGARQLQTQRLVYALAALRAGAEHVEITYCFLERPEEPVTVAYVSSDAQALAADLERLAAGVLGREFAVAQVPHRALCQGCPAEGGLCSWPLELTRRESTDQLFYRASVSAGRCGRGEFDLDLLVVVSAPRPWPAR